MATADQIKALIKSHFGANEGRFFSSALQIAAHEARQGHAALADDIREMVDKAKEKSSASNVIAFPRELGGGLFLRKIRLALFLPL